MTNTETLINSLLSFRDRFSEQLLKSKLAGVDVWSGLMEELDGLIDVFDKPIEIDPAYLKKSSIIDRLGLGFQVIKLYEEDYKEIQIGEILTNQTGLTITTAEVKKWLEINKNDLTISKPVALKGSVFDTQARMQEIFEDLYIRIDTIRAKSEDAYKGNKVSKDEVELEYLKEVRQLVKDAANIVSAVSTMNRVNDFQKLVIEVIGQVSPAAQQQLLRKLNEHRVIMGSLIPPS
jgi:hypothetical protein